MADFTDPAEWGITPEQAVKSRKAALSSYQNISEPALKKAQGQQRGQLSRDVYAQTAGAVEAGRPELTSGLLGQAKQKAAEMLPAQGAKADEAALLGAQAQEDIIGSRQARAVGNLARQNEETKQKAADFISRRAFDMGVQAKQLALHQNGYLAQKAMEQIMEDLQLGRENAADVRALQARMAKNAAMSRSELEKEKAQIMGQLELDLANKDLDAAKARINKLMDRMKKAMEAQAKANALQAILSGTLMIGGTLATGSPTTGGLISQIGSGIVSLGGE